MNNIPWELIASEVLSMLFRTRKTLKKALGEEKGNVIYEDILKQAAMEEDESEAYMREELEKSGISVDDAIDAVLEEIEKIKQKLN